MMSNKDRKSTITSRRVLKKFLSLFSIVTYLAFFTTLAFTQSTIPEGLYQFSPMTQSWLPIASDQQLLPGTRLFNPSPRVTQLNLEGDLLTLGPFTEITIGSIRSINTPTLLEVPSGSIRAQVRTSSPQERGVRFQIQSPVATASVRGTEFQFGWSMLEVTSGDVEVKNLLGQVHSVRANQLSQALVQEPIQSVEISLRRNTRID